MPRSSKIASGERRNWLERAEGGEPVPQIAKEVRRDVRTVREHISKAGLERDFEAALRDQLREALQAHQRDMLGLLDEFRRSVYVPSLEFNNVVGVDFGLEDLWESSELDQNRVTSLDARSAASKAAVVVTRDENGPLEILLTAEGSRLWRAIKEHIGKDSLWRHLADWRKALLEELWRRAELNRALRTEAEQVFGLVVGWRPGSSEPWLAPGSVWWMRARLTKLTLGNYVPDLDGEVRETSGGGLEARSGQWIADNLEDTQTAKAQLQETLEKMTNRAEVGSAAQSYSNLQIRTARVHDALDEFLLIHHLPGRCSLCKKLGG